MSVQDILKQCTVTGTTVKLPDMQLDRKLYLDVKKALELIGGKWKGHNIQGFVFPGDPTDLLAEIASGEKRNLKKEFQFFETPAELADQMVKMAEIERHHMVLEPSAGQGAIIKAILRGNNKPSTEIHYYELMDINRKFLEKIRPTEYIGDDFLNTKHVYFYDRIIANPPFSKNQDIKHVYHMYNKLKSGGRIVTIMSNHWTFANDNESKKFREWLTENDAETHDLHPGIFKSSGTTISAQMVVINKK